MRLRFNKNATEIIKNSEFSIKSFPYTLNEETILEIGMGKGKMLSEMAKQHPELNYIGIEKYSTPALSALKKINALEIKNMKILIGEANNILEYFNGKCKVIWLTFSDPWPKKRHYKRRLTYKTFLEIYKKILTENGVIYFKSDNDSLYEFTLEQLLEINANIIYKTNDLHASNYLEENFFTDYEEKFKNIGKKINFIAFNFNK
ncbi:tRNA (guanosine(46)-N7)-methyltransferase TrmB [Metamycoplasma buccale]|uniref:tRNA (guanosine(46)-N7)-methyltransferase TrmB n=1 Tax=Metamycoplasma buccale TaxID=55602 RepID=UPI00398EB8BD